MARSAYLFTANPGAGRAIVTPNEQGFDELELWPETPWNYALALDSSATGIEVETKRKSMPNNPWAVETTPLALSVDGRRLPDWTLVNEDRMVDAVPAGPVDTCSPTEQIELVPCGAQTEDRRLSVVHKHLTTLRRRIEQVCE